MSDQKYQLYNDCTPLIDSGGPPVEFTITQTLENLLNFSDAGSTIKVQVNGPQYTLTEADIAGVYPTPGSDDSPDEFLPHIALTRRTLPWERSGPGGAKPWLALLLLKNSKLRTTDPKSVVNLPVSQIALRDKFCALPVYADDPTVTVLYLPAATFLAIAPKVNELPMLCHVKRTNKGDGHVADDVDRAIVVASRLPDATPQPEPHTAFLVSLEGRADAYASGRKDNDEIGLVVLHSWSFTPSKGADFAQVVRAIGVRPNGGVLRFGNVPSDAVPPESAPLFRGFEALLDADGLFIDGVEHTQPTKATYRGPLRPFPTEPRSPGFAVAAAPEEFADSLPGLTQDYSHAAAYELGRLLALANPEMLEDLRQIYVKAPPPPPEVAINKIPVAILWPRWLIDPAQVNTHPWEIQQDGKTLAPIAKSEQNFADFVGTTPGDVLGIHQQLGALGGQVTASLTGLPGPEAITVDHLDLDRVDAAGLSKIFAATIAKAR